MKRFFLFLLALFLLGCTQPNPQTETKPIVHTPQINLSDGAVTTINNATPAIFYCSDGTAYGNCSNVRPYLCSDGNLVINEHVCGCGRDEILENSSCRPANNCTYLNQSAVNGKCLSQQPLFCNDGTIMNYSSLCGCPSGYDIQDDQCMNPYPADGTKNFFWSYHSSTYNLNLPMSQNLEQYYSSKPREYLCSGQCPQNWEQQYYSEVINDPLQQEAIDKLVSSVQGPGKEERLFALLELVKEIPYDSSSSGLTEYPYEVLYNNRGVCNGKALLGALIAKKLGFGVAVFSYDAEEHMALGLECPIELSNYNSGYCFLEMTSNCSRLADNSGDYGNGKTLTSTPNVFVLNPDGDSLSYETVNQDVQAVASHNALQKKMSDLEKLMTSSGEPELYNTYVDEFNQYVDEYNSFSKCD